MDQWKVHGPLSTISSVRVIIKPSWPIRSLNQHLFIIKPVIKSNLVKSARHQFDTLKLWFNGPMIPLPFQNWKIIQNFYAPKLDFKDSNKAKSNLMKTDFGSQLNFRSNEIPNENFQNSWNFYCTVFKIEFRVMTRWPQVTSHGLFFDLVCGLIFVWIRYLSLFTFIFYLAIVSTTKRIDDWNENQRSANSKQARKIPNLKIEFSRGLRILELSRQRKLFVSHLSFWKF